MSYTDDGRISVAHWKSDALSTSADQQSLTSKRYGAARLRWSEPLAAALGVGLVTERDWCEAVRLLELRVVSAQSEVTENHSATIRELAETASKSYPCPNPPLGIELAS